MRFLPLFVDLSSGLVAVVGTGPDVAQRIEDLRARVGVEEMAVVTWTHDEAVRRASYTHLARAMGFAPAGF